MCLDVVGESKSLVKTCHPLPRGSKMSVQILVMRNKAILKPLSQGFEGILGEIGYRHVVITFITRNAGQLDFKEKGK